MLYPDFLADIHPGDLRLRFFAPMAQVSPALIDRLIHYDPDRAMAFIAVAEQDGRMLGVVRLHDDANGNSAEFTILVRSPLKGRGLGWLLMRRIIDYARDKGLKIVHGQVLSENVTMLSMCAEFGFHIADDTTDRGMKYVTLTIATAAPDGAAGRQR